MEANIRGNLLIQSNGQSIILRPTMAGLVALEQKLGLTIIELVGLFSEQKSKLSHVQAILWIGIHGGKSLNPATGLPYTEEEADEVLVDIGMVAAMRAAASMMMSVVSGGKGAEAVTPGKA